MERSQFVLTGRAVLLLALLFVPSRAFADAIMPSLVLVWPITIFLFVPVVLIEAVYTRMRLGIGFWECTRVTLIANVMSTIAGLPFAYLLSAGLQYALEAYSFRDMTALRANAAQLVMIVPDKLDPHDAMNLIFLGLYPRWIMVASAVAMMTICFLVSWWIEGKWLARHVKRTMPASADACMNVARNANLLSYVFLTLVVIWALLAVWPHGMH